MTWKKTGKLLMILILAVALTAGGYAAYLFLSYDRIADNQEIQVHNPSAAIGVPARVGETYTAVTYNVGFGAYSDDYSFFMDGGKYSRAYSEQAVLDNTAGDLDTLEQQNPDLILLQEVDRDSTRSYHVDMHDMFCQTLADYAVNHAVNFHSAYLAYPFTEPHGASVSGVSTFARMEMTSALRRSLPISTSVYKLVDLDRCYVITRIPTDNGKELAVYNVHLSAYTDDPAIVYNQVKMLTQDLQKDLDAGNYIICGGDFNQDMLGNSPEIYGTGERTETWAKPFAKELLPQGTAVTWEQLTQDELKAMAPTCRNADSPYEPGVSYVTTVDGFILSDNVELLELETVDNGFRYSDHNLVRMQFRLN